MMVASGVRSACRAKLPALTAAMLTRPLICARMLQKLSFDLMNLRLDRTTVQGEQEIALPHHRAIPEMDSDDFGVDPGLDRNARDRRDGTHELDPHRYLLLHRA